MKHPTAASSKGSSNQLSPRSPHDEFRSIRTQWATAQALAEAEANRAQAQARAARTKSPVSSERELAKVLKGQDEHHNEVKEREFKAQHAGILGMLGWILFIHVIGIYFFTKGFLLTRLVLEDKSQCAVLPFSGSKSALVSNVSGEEGCWHRKSFDKAIVIVIDALRYDFAVPFLPTAEGQRPRAFHNNLPILYETAVETPQNAFLLPFIADPPTTTLQRLKGLTTGTLPTFIDAGSNFAGTAIDEDNLITQLRDAGKRLVHLGDDTWHSLFPDFFDPTLSHPYDSFNVWDLHTVDNGVTEHLFPLLHRDNSTKWDVIFGHYLGVDHAGHRYGPDHPAMAAKLSQMDRVIRGVIKYIDEDTLLVVLGDHGMDSKGDHGGESDDEVEAALWMYSKKRIFGRRNFESLEPPRTAKQRPIPQIDLVPTLALLLGMPIPFNNLGSPIEEAFVGIDGNDLENLIAVNRLAAAQIKRYQHQYAVARGVDENRTSGPLSTWAQTENAWLALLADPQTDRSILQQVYHSYREYQRDTLSVCRGFWAKFDVPSMVQGIMILFAGLLLLVFYARGIRGNQTDISFPTLKRIGIGSALGCFAAVALAYAQLLHLPLIEAFVLGTGIGGLFGGASTISWIRKQISPPLPTSLWAWLAVVFTMSQSLGFASNSYTIWEDEVLLFFLSTFGVLTALSSMRLSITKDRVVGIYHSAVFVVLGRVASLSRLCREEQMPFCRSTYYVSATSSTSAAWQLFIPFLLSLMLPSVIRSYYKNTKSYVGSAIFWIGFAFRLGLLLVAIFWTLDAADDGDWLGVEKSSLKWIRVVLAQIVLAIAFAAGTTTFAWAKPCVSIVMTPDTQSSGVAPPKTSITILGYANVYGTRYFLLLVNFALAIILMQKPMGTGVIGIQVWQILSLIEVLDVNCLLASNSAIGPVVLGLLGSFHFFKTGHQATLSSIQWDSAFIPLSSVRYPWSPLLVILNTFGAQILTAVAVPLMVLWKRPINARGAPIGPRPPKDTMKRLLADTVQAASTHILYYATVNLATTIWAAWLRRHLMLYRIFSPRFMMGAIVLIVVDVVVSFVAIGGLRWSMVSVGDVFGWE